MTVNHNPDKTLAEWTEYALQVVRESATEFGWKNFTARSLCDGMILCTMVKYHRGSAPDEHACLIITNLDDWGNEEEQCVFAEACGIGEAPISWMAAIDCVDSWYVENSPSQPKE
jgi:hypothetical protein